MRSQSLNPRFQIDDDQEGKLDLSLLGPKASRGPKLRSQRGSFQSQSSSRHRLLQHGTPSSHSPSKGSPLPTNSLNQSSTPPSQRHLSSPSGQAASPHRPKSSLASIPSPFNSNVTHRARPMSNQRSARARVSQEWNQAVQQHASPESRTPGHPRWGLPVQSPSRMDTMRPPILEIPVEDTKNGTEGTASADIFSVMRKKSVANAARLGLLHRRRSGAADCTPSNQDDSSFGQSFSNSSVHSSSPSHSHLGAPIRRTDSSDVGDVSIASPVRRFQHSGSTVSVNSERNTESSPSKNVLLVSVPAKLKTLGTNAKSRSQLDGAAAKKLAKWRRGEGVPGVKQPIPDDSLVEDILKENIKVKKFKTVEGEKFGLEGGDIQQDPVRLIMTSSEKGNHHDGENDQLLTVWIHEDAHVALRRQVQAELERPSNMVPSSDGLSEVSAAKWLLDAASENVKASNFSIDDESLSSMLQGSPLQPSTSTEAQSKRKKRSPAVFHSKSPPKQVASEVSKNLVSDSQFSPSSPTFSRHQEEMTQPQIMDEQLQRMLIDESEIIPDPQGKEAFRKGIFTQYMRQANLLVDRIRRNPTKQKEKSQAKKFVIESPLTFDDPFRTPGIKIGATGQVIQEEIPFTTTSDLRSALQDAAQEMDEDDRLVVLPTPQGNIDDHDLLGDQGLFGRPGFEGELIQLDGVTDKLVVPGVPEVIPEDAISQSLNVFRKSFGEALKDCPVSPAFGCCLILFTHSSSVWGVPVASKLARLVHEQDLLLANAGMGPPAMAALSELIILIGQVSNQKFKEININNNRIGDVGSVALFSALHLNRNIKSLHLHAAGFKGVAIFALACALSGDREIPPWQAAINEFNRTKQVSKGIQVAEVSEQHAELNDEVFAPDEDSEEADAEDPDASKVPSVELELLAQVALRSSSLVSKFKIKPAQCRIEHLDLSKNRMGPRAATRLFESLIQNTSTKTLILSHCDISERSGDALSELLSRNSTITHLDLSWNRLREQGAVKLGEGLTSNDSITNLNIAWNGCGSEVGCKSISQALEGSFLTLQKLNLASNRISHAGAMLLAEGIKVNKTLLHIVMDGNPLGQMGGRAILRAAAKEGGMMLEDADENVSNMQEEDKTQVSMLDCNIGFVDPSAFDPSDPAGSYTLDLEEAYSRVIVENLVMLQEQGKGEFVPGSVRKNGEFWRIPTGEAAMDWTPPEAGLVSFDFQGMRKPPSDDDVIADIEVGFILDLLQQSKKSKERADIINMVTTSDKFFLVSQAETLLAKCQDSNERVVFVSQAMYRLVGKEENLAQQLLDNLTPAELKELQGMMSDSAKKFKATNPTGKYKFDLGRDSDREVVMRLVEIRNRQLEELKSLPKPRGELECNRCEKPERIMRNVTLSKKPVEITPNYQFPRSGILEFDFTSQDKPGPNAEVIVSGTMPEVRKLETEAEKIDYWRDLLAQKAIKLTLAKVALDDLKEPDMRVEFMCMVHSRLVEYHGYNQLVKRLSKDEKPKLHKRLGIHNVYDSFSAVGFYELDLGNAEHRYVMADLVRLAVIEPGDNVIDSWYCGLQYEIPASWCNKIAHKGDFFLYYCRSKQVIAKIVGRETNPKSIPFNYDEDQPADTDWVALDKRFKIKEKLAKKFPTPEKCFAEMDEDGGGSLDRTELARGLRKSNIWLHPNELVSLLDWLDEDGSGSIELDEMQAFWYSVPEVEEVAIDEDA